jgi:hypothetical protein
VNTEPAPGPPATRVAAARRTLSDFDAIVEAGQWGELTELQRGMWAGRLSEGLRDTLAALDAKDAAS